MVNFLATETKVLEPGLYGARLDQIEERDGTFIGKTGQSENGTYLSWKFAITEAGHEGDVVYANSSTNFGPKAKARKWAGGILGREITTGTSLSEDDLVGHTCYLALSVERDRDGDPRNVIDSIMPLKGENTPTTAATRPQSVNTPVSLESVALIRRFEQAKAALGWNHPAYDKLMKQQAGWTPKAIAERPEMANFAKLIPEVQVAVVGYLEYAVEHPEEYDEDGDLKF